MDTKCSEKTKDQDRCERKRLRNTGVIVFNDIQKKKLNDMIPHCEFTINDVIKSFYMTESGFITEYRRQAIDEKSDSVFLEGLKQETIEKKVPNIKGTKKKLIDYIIREKRNVIGLLRDEQIRTSDSKEYLSIFHYNTIWSKIGYTNKYIIDLCRYKKKVLIDCIKKYAEKYNLNLSIGDMPSLELDEVIRQYFEFSVKIVKANSGDKRFLISSNIILEEDEFLQSYTKKGVLPTSLLVPFSIPTLKPRPQLPGMRVNIPKIPQNYSIDISRIKPWIKGYKKSYIVTSRPFCFSADCLHILNTVNSRDFNFNYIYRFRDDMKIAPEHIIIKLMVSIDIWGREYKWILFLKKDKLDTEVDRSQIFILSKNNILSSQDETVKDNVGKDISRDLNIDALFTYEVNDIIEREFISNAELNLNVHPASLKVPEQMPLSSPHPAFDPLVKNQWRFKNLTFFIVHLTDSGYIFGDNELKMKEVEWYKRYNEPFVMKKNCLFNFEKARAIEKKIWLYPTWHRTALIKEGYNSNILKINNEIIGYRNPGENEFVPTEAFNHILYGNTRLCHRYNESGFFLYTGRNTYEPVEIKYYLHESRYMERNLQIHNQENRWFDLNLGEHCCKLLAEDIKTSNHIWTLRYLCLLNLQKALHSCFFYYNKKNINNESISTFETGIFRQLKEFKVIDYLETITKFILVFSPNPSLSLFNNMVLQRGINWIEMDTPLENIYPELFSNNRTTNSQREQFRIDFSIASNQFIKNVAKICYEGGITPQDTAEEKLQDALENKISNKKLIKLLEKVDIVSTPRVGEIVIKLDSGEEINIDYSSYYTIFSQPNLVEKMEKLGDDIMSELGLTREQKRPAPPTPEQERAVPPTPKQKRPASFTPEQKRPAPPTPEQKFLITDLNSVNLGLMDILRINNKFKNSAFLQDLDDEISNILSNNDDVVTRIESIISKLRKRNLSEEKILKIINRIIN